MEKFFFAKERNSALLYKLYTVYKVKSAGYFSVKSRWVTRAGVGGI